MQAIVFAALLAAASATTVFRTPSHDSAVINSQRVGGNFAYSVNEAQAYGVVSPVVSHVTAPVATTYSVQQPVTTSVVSSPVVSSPVVSSSVVSTPVVSTVKKVDNSVVPVTSNVVPVTSNVATTYSSWPYNYWYGNTAVVKSDSPIVYNSNGVEKQIDQVHSSVVSPVASVQYPSTVVTGNTVSHVSSPVTYTTVQEPGTVSHVSSPVTYSTTVQQPVTSVVGGTPAHTYKTVNGVNYVYGAGHPWTYVNSVVV